jgi:hypothetical protein
MHQRDLFSQFFDGIQRKKEGLDRIEEHHAEWVDLARAVARAKCQTKGYCTGDEIRAWVEVSGRQPPHKNCYGAIWRSGEFVRTGYKQSVYPSNNARVIAIWRLKP